MLNDNTLTRVLMWGRMFIMFCKNCGNEMKDGVKFCGKCGTSIENDDSEQQNVSTSNDQQQDTTEGDENKRMAAAFQEKSDKVINAGTKGCAGICMILIAIGVIGVLIVVIGLIIMGVKHITHGKLDVNEVQEAYLEDYDDITIGDALEDYSYFYEISWDENTTQYNGEEIDVVSFNAIIEVYDIYSNQYIDEPITIKFIRDNSYDIELLCIAGNRFFDLNEELVIGSIYNNEEIRIDSSNTFTWGQ